MLLLMTGALAGTVVGGVYSVWASQLDMGDVQQIKARSTVFDRDGKPYGRLQGENRLVVGRKQVSDFFVNALLAREDSRFYRHPGVDAFGIVRAALRNLLSRSAAQGASTLTQQLARNSYPLGGKNIHRKILEAFVSFRIEKYYSKDEILEHYMNRIYLGAGVYGIETASQAYFNKRALDLSLGEAAMLAGIIRGPSRFSPVTNFQAALRERDTVLERMVKMEMIPQAQADAAREAPIVLNPRRRLTVQENYAMDAVVRELGRVLSEDQLSESGLRIYTTLDPILQDVAQTALDVHLTKIESQPKYAHPKKAEFTKEAREAELDPAYLQGAVVVLDNRTGGIRALVGGRDYAESRYNRALLSERPIGSTFKPFVYLAAFSHGLSPETSVSDGPIQRGEVRGAPNWSPGNSDGTFKGAMSAEEGLIQSRNTVTVRVGEQVGLPEVGRIGALVGLDKMPQRPSAYLGAFEASLMRITNAYTVFPNGGTMRQPFLIERVDDAGGTTLYRANSPVRRALQPGGCALVTGVLTKVLDRGTAAAARAGGFKKIAGGKTGTTDDYKDAWFVGFTSSLTAGVWVGFDKPQRTVSQGYGATMALPVWVEVMNAAPEGRYPAKALRTFGEVSSYRPPAAVPAGGANVPAAEAPPPRVEPVQSQGNPPRVEPVLER
ncbi:MAG: PBP1A family penicillin-binding protein, partial [Verrucomicrobia bacterium]|nr:PBP1A family penicillin-binding protein [Verrucomicrobiota bacterium]